MPRFPFLRVALAGGVAAVAGVAAADRWRRTWGVVPEEAAQALAGDDIVSNAVEVMTHGITIDAPPDTVWPWLVQMGYGRGGWYSYDQLDMRGRSANAIVPQWQSIAVGDTVPTDPGGGFEVRVVEPEHALVLFADSALMARRGTTPETTLDATEVPGLAASGRFLETATPPDFSISWAFVLEPREGGRTRLIERFRLRGGKGDMGSRLLAPILGFGVFVMMRRQMLGIRDRAEYLARTPVTETWMVTPGPNGRTPAEVTETEAPVG